MNYQISRKIMKFFILVAFLYHLFDLTQEHLQHEYLINVEVKEAYSLVPSVTICVNPLHRMSYSRKWKNSYVLFNETLICGYWDYNYSRYIRCEEFDPEVFIRFKNNTVCLTYLNNAGHFKYNIFHFFAKSFRRAEFIFHLNFQPSHFERSNSFIVHIGKIIRQMGALLQVNRWDKTLLPFPYATNCFDYSINRRNNVSPKSENDCKLVYMRRKEIKECNHNYYWSQHRFDIKHQTIDFNQKFPNCSVEVNQTFLGNMCRKDCSTTELVVSKEDYISYFFGSLVYFKRYSQNYIHLTYLAKMDLIAYFSTMGGLISIYLGLGVINLTNICLDSILKFCVYLIKKQRLNSKINILLHSMKSISKIIFLSLMFYQLIEMTNDFIYYNERTDITFRDNYRFPKIVLFLRPQLNYRKFRESYPEFYNKHNRVKNLKTEDDYLLDLLIKNISELKYMTNFNDLKIKCKFEYESIHVDCPEPLEYIQTFRSHDMYINHQFIHSSDSRIPRSVSLELTGDFLFNSMYLQLSSLSILGSYGENTFSEKYIHPWQINTYTINSIVTRKISNNKHPCIYNNNKKQYSDYLNDEITMDCIQRETNETFGCLPVIGVDSWIRTERDLNHFSICPKNIGNNNYSIIESIVNRCFDKVVYSCETHIFSAFDNHRKNAKKFSTKINILFKTDFIPEYKQNYRMNFNEWVYNCGGIIGLWFGWSALSLSVIPLIFQHYFKLIKLYYNHLKQYLSIIEREVTINHHFIIIENYQVIIYHQVPKTNYLKLISILNKCKKILCKLFVWSALLLLAIIIFIGNCFVKIHELISRIHIKRYFSERTRAKVVNQHSIIQDNHEVLVYDPRKKKNYLILIKNVVYNCARIIWNTILWLTLSLLGLMIFWGNKLVNFYNFMITNIKSRDGQTGF